MRPIAGSWPAIGFYVAYGRQFTRLANVQLGFLWQARRNADFFRLQIFYTYNFDLRD